jgi:hypothetical protein
MAALRSAARFINAIVCYRLSAMSSVELSCTMAIRTLDTSSPSHHAHSRKPRRMRYRAVSRSNLKVGTRSSRHLYVE